VTSAVSMLRLHKASTTLRQRIGTLLGNFHEEFLTAEVASFAPGDDETCRGRPVRG
jgi:hypothetical protein